MQTDTLAQEKPSRENLWLAMLGIRLACVARTFSLYMTSSLLIPAISEGLDYQSHPSTVSNGRKSLVFSTSISFATRNCSRQKIIWYSDVSTYLDIPLVFHVPLWSTFPQFRPQAK